MKMSRGGTVLRRPNRWNSRNLSLDSGFGSDSEDSRKELCGCVPKCPSTLQSVPSHVIEGELLAESMRHPRKPQSPGSSNRPCYDVPFQWVQISGFPCDATDQILKSFVCVGTILKKRRTRHSLQLQYAFTVEACRALEFNSVCICSYKVRVEPLLGDPEERDMAKLTNRATEFPLYCQNPEYPKFRVRKWRQCNCRLNNQKRWFSVWISYSLMVFMGLLFYWLGCWWRSFNNWMKSWNANGNETHPGVGYHCDLVNNSVNRHLKASRESATKATHYRKYPSI